MGPGSAGITGNDAGDLSIVREPRPEIGRIDQHVESRQVRRRGDVLHLNRTNGLISRHPRTPQAHWPTLGDSHADAGRYGTMHWLLMATVYTHARSGQHRTRVPARP